MYQCIFFLLLSSLSSRLLAGGAVSTQNLSSIEKKEIQEDIRDMHKYAQEGDGPALAAHLVFFPSTDINAPDKNGDTVLITAIKKSYPGIINFMFQQNDLNVNIRNKNGETALFNAAAANNTNVAKHLLESYPVNPSVADNKGKTPLMVAAENDNDAIVNLLLKYGADIALKDLQGKSALDYARGKSKTILENYQRKLENIYRKHFQEVYEKQGVNVPTEIENLMVSYSLPASIPEKIAKK